MEPLGGYGQSWPEQGEHHQVRKLQTIAKGVNDPGCCKGEQQWKQPVQPVEFEGDPAAETEVKVKNIPGKVCSGQHPE